MFRLLALLVISVTVLGINAQQQSAVEAFADIYESCLRNYNVKCAKPKALSWISKAINQDEIKISDTLTIIRTGTEEPETEIKEESRSDKTIYLFNKIDSFIATHSLKVGVPEILKSNEARSFIPETYLNGGFSEDMVVPLSAGNVAEGRGFVKKVMIPFLLGIKFKATVLVPIALALIALKTWKAMTLGLLSLVLSGAMVIFKFAKPKIVNYEVVHYPHHIDHHDHHIDHHVAHPPHHHHVAWEPQPGWARSMDAAQPQAYSAYV